jgi:phosphoribosylanthranilate isomerase
MTARVRTKICGITRQEDAQAAVRAGADAIGLVFYAPSPRAVTPAQAAQAIAGLSPFVTVVGLFVNATREDVLSTLAAVPLDLLQFHGDETPAYCGQFARPFLKALQVAPQTQPGDLINYAAAYAAVPGARGILLDAHVEGLRGGTGRTFNWGVIPSGLALPVVLSGGLSPDNVAEAVRRVRPAALDVSSGVERAPGIKDHAKIEAFITQSRLES